MSDFITSDKIKLHWKIVEDAKLQILLEGHSLGWVGLGLSVDGTMPSGGKGLC